MTLITHFRRYSRISSAVSAVALVGLVSAGCQNAMYDENLALHSQARQLQEDKKSLMGELETRPTDAQVASLRTENQAKAQRIAELERQLAERLAMPDESGLMIPGIDNVEIGLNDAGTEMTMRVPGDVLFASGSDTVNSGAKATLNRIADILQSDYAGSRVRVEGHTDADPIKRSKGKYDSNRDLSLRRAYAVTKVLEGSGVPASRIETVGHGEHQTLGQGKKKDRRVEIVVVL
jgi:outer membrane protein OmpA-like peptidoglycan-associated protein